MVFADYTGRISPSALLANKVTGVCRYLSWLPNPKVIQQEEYNTLVNGGIRVVLNWEYDGLDWLGGASAARSQALEAIRQAKALGYPPGSPIPGSADFDMTHTQWTSVCRDYAMTYGGALVDAGYRPGVYSSYDVLGWCRYETPFDWWTWQSMSTAYSQRRNAMQWDGVNLWQKSQASIAGVSVDLSTVVTEWGAMNLDLGTVGAPSLGYSAWSKDGVPRSAMQGVVLLDMAAQEFDGVSNWDGKSKSQRQQLLEEVRDNLRTLVNRPQGTVTLTDQDKQDIANLVGTQIATKVVAALETWIQRP